MRASYEELEKVKKKYGVGILWSFSRFDTYRTSPYEFFLKYVKKFPENNEKQSAYGVLGNAAHTCLENYYEKKLNYEELANEFDDAFVTNIDILGLYFDRTDSVKNENIKTKYYKDIMSYFKNFQPIKQKTLMEQFLTIKIADDIIFIGYSDCLHIDEDGNYVISDFKTSSIYSKTALAQHSAQLVLYSEALRQRGIPSNKIKARFLFLKYVSVDCEQVNGKIKTRNIERCELGSKLQASVKVWLKKLGYEDNMMEYLDELVQTNSLECLPDDVQTKYCIHDTEVYIDDIWDLYDNLKEEIIETVAEINSKVEEYKITQDEHLFWDSEESLKAQSYYFNNLCGYSVATIKPYKEYLDKMTAQKEGNIFGTKKNTNEYAENDLSWLNDL